MGPEWVAIIGLIALFVVGTAVPINMGALGFVAAWMVGMWSLDMDEKDIVAGISADLVLTLIGVTYLFAIARKNGTVDLIVRVAVKAVRGRVALIPWVMFAITACSPRSARSARRRAPSSARSRWGSRAATASAR